MLRVPSGVCGKSIRGSVRDIKSLTSYLYHVLLVYFIYKYYFYTVHNNNKNNNYYIYICIYVKSNNWICIFSIITLRGHSYIEKCISVYLTNSFRLRETKKKAGDPWSKEYIRADTSLSYLLLIMETRSSFRIAASLLNKLPNLEQHAEKQSRLFPKHHRQKPLDVSCQLVLSCGIWKSQNMDCNVVQ